MKTREDSPGDSHVSLAALSRRCLSVSSELLVETQRSRSLNYRKKFSRYDDNLAIVIDLLSAVSSDSPVDRPVVRRNYSKGGSLIVTVGVELQYIKRS